MNKPHEQWIEWNYVAETDGIVADMSAAGMPQKSQCLMQTRVHVKVNTTRVLLIITYL